MNVDGNIKVRPCNENIDFLFKYRLKSAVIPVVTTISILYALKSIYLVVEKSNYPTPKWCRWCIFKITFRPLFCTKIMIFIYCDTLPFIESYLLLIKFRLLVVLSAFKHLCPTFKTILVHILISWIKRQATLILKMLKVQ